MLVAAAGANAAMKDPGAVDAVIDGYVRDGYLALLYVRIEDRDGHLLYEHGARNPALVTEPVRGDSWFRIWSMSKIITISLALDLVEEGVIALDDPVTDHLPEFGAWRIAVGPGGEDLVDTPFDEREALCPVQTVPMERPPTVRDLINHQDGLTYAWTGMSCLDTTLRAARLADARSSEELIERLAGLPLVNAPGTRENYGLGTTVLGLLLERATGKALNDLVAERITEPLGIDGLAYRLPPGEALPPRFIGDGDTIRVARPEELDIFGGSQPRYRPDEASTLYLGGEGMVGTASAYADFARMLLRRGELDGVRLLEEATVEDMTAPHTELDNEWGYNGYNLWISNGRLSDGGQGPAPLWMGGGYEGTRFWIDPAREFIGVIMTQVHQPPAGADSVDEAIRRAVYEQFGWSGSEP
jgi:CubicO group peptidase (beta-lactamase class C family)